MTARASPAGSTRLVALMADQLAARGAPHPVAGALAAAVRGRHRLDVTTFADALDLTTEAVQAAESGDVSLRRLPEPIRARLPWLGVDLVALAPDHAA